MDCRKGLLLLLSCFKLHGIRQLHQSFFFWYLKKKIFKLAFKPLAASLMKLDTYLKHRKKKLNVPSLLLCQAAENVLLDVTRQNVRRGRLGISHDMSHYLSISYPHGPLRESQWGYAFIGADQNTGWQGIINTGPRPGDSGSWHFNLGEQVNYLKVFYSLLYS